MEKIDQRGVSDIIAIAAMFIILILISVFIHGYLNIGLQDAANRRNELKANHFQETFKKATIKPHNISGLQAAAQQLTVKNPTIENKKLHSWYENTINKLRPPNFGVEITLTNKNKKWKHITPENKSKENYISKGTVTISKTDNNMEIFYVEVRLFEIG